MRLTALPNGRIFIDGKEVSNNDYKGFLLASSIFEQAATLYEKRGGFSERGTQLDKIRSKRNG
jgi:hypothetical protein